MAGTDRDDDAPPAGPTLPPRERDHVEQHADTVLAPRAVRSLSAPTVELGPIDGGRDQPRGKTVPPPATRAPFDLGDDRFEARGEIGRGGMGRVDHAFDRVLGRAVAIKHLLRASEQDLARFAREARLTARLEHPGVVPIHDVGYGPDGKPYYVMRRVDGRPLAELVDRATLAARLALIPNVLAACDAVAFAHARGIVHRDLKPQNILVGRFGETLVIDWGLAREIDLGASASGSALPVSDESVTVAGTVAGTPGFMAPEQARGEAVDARADVFALGATLFFALSGAFLYDSTSATEMVSFASSGRTPNWTALPAGVPADLRAILVKAVANDPAARYADAGALAVDLRRFVTGNLVGAHQYGALVRLSRFVRRHRAIVATVVASVIVLAAAGVVSVRRVVVERDAASAARTLAETRQREATDAADHMLIAHAQELAATDPIAAITLLRQLDASSSRWHDAWLAAVAAWTRGIPFGFRGDNPITWVQIAADNRHATTASISGEIAVYDLVARTQRIVATIPGATMCQWIGEHEVLCRDRDNRLSIVDTERATTKALDIQARGMISDRRSRAVVETQDHQILEIAGPDGTSRVLATDGILGGASLDLDEVAFWHGAALELWTPSGVLPVARFASEKVARMSSAIEIRDHTVVAIVGDETIRWHVEGDHVVEDQRWPRQLAVDVALADGHVYTQAGVELSIDGVAMRGLEASRFYITARGLGIGAENGTIVVLDGGRQLRLGPYPTRIERADLSLDGRFLIAVSDDDQVLAWDLDRLRPRTVLVETRETPILLAPPSLWTLDLARGIVRRELGTDRTGISLAAFFVPGGWLGVAEDARWIGVREPQSAQIQVYDATLRRDGRIYHVVAQAADIDGIVSATADGTLHKWRPGTGRSDEIGRLPAAPLGLGVGGTFVVALFDHHKVSRLDVATGARADGEIDDDVRDIVVASRGDTWIVTVNGVLWRWAVGASPRRVELAEPVETIGRESGHILARTSRSLIEVDVEPVHAVPTDARTARPLSVGYLATLSAHGEVSVLDLETGARVVLPATATTEALVTRGDTLLFASERVDDKDRYDAIDLAVPHDPAALQRWLRDVTNASPGGDWPSP